MAKRKKVENSPVWECAACLGQFRGEGRCPQHSPTPEQRAARPDLYRRERYANKDDDARLVAARVAQGKLAQADEPD